VHTLSCSRKHVRPHESKPLVFQLEVKRWLVHWRFPPAEGWKVHVDIDSMERANGGKHPEGKALRASIAETALVAVGARIGAHPRFGRADVVAEHPHHGVWLIEVEGESSRQKEQAVYSALGQLLLQMDGDSIHFALAVPDAEAWQRQVAKVPEYALTRLNLRCLLVSELGVRER
jgi:hypothetical protein